MSYQLIKKDIKRQPYSFFLVFFLGIAAGLLRSLPPAMIKELIEVWETAPPDYDKIVQIPIAIALVWITAAVLRYFVMSRMRFIAVIASLNLRKDLLKKYLYSSLSFLDSSNTGRGGLISRMLYDVGIIKGGIYKIADLIKEPVVFVATFGYLVYLDWKLTGILLITLPITVYIVSRVSKSLKKHAHKNQEIMEKVTSTLKESLDGSKIIRSFNLENKMDKSFTGLIDNFFETRKKIIEREEMTGPLNESLGFIPFTAVLIIVGYSIAAGNMTVAEFTGFLSAIAICTDAGKKVQNAYVRIQQALVARERVESTLSNDNTIKSPETPKDFPENWIDISFNNVCYSVGSVEILKNISFKIKAGQSLALVGLSGSGKTTIINLLERFIDPTSGSISIGGVNIKDFSISELRKNISLVSQDVFLFNETIEENISDGIDKKTDMKEIVNCAKLANADEFINSFEKGYETKVGDGGARLSGGEKQRISIARAMIKKAPILLLDEATSALDTKSEVLVQSGLDELMKGVTSIVIAHRLSTIKNIDRILVMDKGKIIQDGNHDELMSVPGEYQKLASYSKI